MAIRQKANKEVQEMFQALDVGLLLVADNNLQFSNAKVQNLVSKIEESSDQNLLDLKFLKMH
jgi:hypothetical protein